MAEVATRQDFLNLVCQSGLIASHKLEMFIESNPSLRGAATMTPRMLADLLIRAGLLTEYQARRLLDGSYAGFFILGKYKLLELLGSGGMGKVFLAEHLHLRRLLAIKMMPISDGARPGTVERFYREARASASLQHPNIVRALDVDRDDTLHVLVMEYVDGTDLQVLAARTGPLSPARAVNYIYQAAMGLQHAHEAGWVHRDIKPGNLILDRSGVVKVLDLGLARLFHDEADNLTQQYANGAIMGTADYIAPEQALASHAVDIRADIYSLGATLYYLLTAQPPFSEGSIAQKLLWHQMRAPRPLRSLRPEVPQPIADIVERMLAKDPAARYPTPAAIAEALAPWNGPVPAPTDAEMPRLNLGQLQMGVADVEQGMSVSVRLSRSDLFLGVQPNVQPNNESRTETVSLHRGVRTPPSSAALSPSSGPVRSATNSRASISRPPTMKSVSLSKATMPDVNVNSALMPRTKVLGPAPDTNAKENTKRSRGVLFMALGLFVLIASIGGGAAWYFMQDAPPKRPDPGPGNKPAPVATGPTLPDGPTLFVTRNRLSPFLGKPRVYDSLARAVENARAGDRIALLDQTFEERLVIHGAKLPKNITIEGNPDLKEPVIWKSPAREDADTPVLTLVDVDGWVVRGIAFDAESRVSSLLEIAGHCPGLRLEQVQLGGFRKSAVVFKACSGLLESPVLLKRVTIQSPAPARDKDSQTVALEFASSGDAAGRSQYVHVVETLFRGSFREFVRFDCPVDGMRFQRDRFYKAKTAFRWDHPTPPLRCTVLQSTFYAVQTLVELGDTAALPENHPDAGLTFKQNVFAKVSSFLHMTPRPGGTPRWLFQACEYNFRDADSGSDGPAPFPTTEKPIALSLETDDAHLLRYLPTSPLAEAGPDRTPVGVPPE